MGAINICLPRCTCLPKQVSSSFILSSAKISTVTNTLQKELSWPGLLTVSTSSALTRRINELKRDNSHRLHQNITGNIRNFSISSQLESSNEPLQPQEDRLPHICWNCGADFSLDCEKDQLNNLLTCSKCNVLRIIPKDANYFDLFGIPRTFKMDLKKLAQKYKSMQRILHPDR